MITHSSCKGVSALESIRMDGHPTECTRYCATWTISRKLFDTPPGKSLPLCSLTLSALDSKQTFSAPTKIPRRTITKLAHNYAGPCQRRTARFSLHGPRLSKLTPDLPHFKKGLVPKRAHVQHPPSTQTCRLVANHRRAHLVRNTNDTQHCAAEFLQNSQEASKAFHL